VKTIQIAVFASGNGSNAYNLYEYFKNHPSVNVTHLFCNKPNAPVIKRFENTGVKTIVFNKQQFNTPEYILNNLKEVDFIVLAGFLWLIPEYLIDAFSNRILNLHPSLLPKFGGKGMYGNYVHQAVIQSGETQSGITIHLVNKEYDKGKIIFQTSCTVDKTDTPETLAQKINRLELKFLPMVVEQYVYENSKTNTSVYVKNRNKN
jgi:phosphoribosylglycinamide formyltransferase-1